MIIVWRPGKINLYIWADIQAALHTDIRTALHTDIQADIQTDIQTDIRTHDWRLCSLAKELFLRLILSVTAW